MYKVEHDLRLYYIKYFLLLYLYFFSSISNYTLIFDYLLFAFLIIFLILDVISPIDISLIKISLHSVKILLFIQVILFFSSLLFFPKEFIDNWDKIVKMKTDILKYMNIISALLKYILFLFLLKMCMKVKLLKNKAQEIIIIHWIIIIYNFYEYTDHLTHCVTHSWFMFNLGWISYTCPFIIIHILYCIMLCTIENIRKNKNKQDVEKLQDA